MEIERKYLIQCSPKDLTKYSFKVIEQGYLCHNPTIRIRKIGDDYILTYKSKINQLNMPGANKAIINNEVELELTQEAYLQLKDKVDGYIIHKKRYYIPLEAGLTAELDVFDNQLKGFIMAEVEFPNEKTSDTFVPPEWFGKELTSDKRFSNYNLSKLSGLDELVL
jgi:CYTH domain-containing protein